MKMNIYLRSLILYFENVLHPAAGSQSGASKNKAKRNVSRSKEFQVVSPECFNIRGGMVKKQEKLRRNPAP